MWLWNVHVCKHTLQIWGGGNCEASGKSISLGVNVPVVPQRTMFSLPHSVHVWVCVCFYLCVWRWMEEVTACSGFFCPGHFFLNVYSEWEHSSQCLTSASLLFKTPEKAATCGICMCMCVLGWIQQWHQLSLDTSPNGTQGHKGTRARGLSSGRPFPKPQGLWGIGPGRVWWDLLMFVAGATHWKPPAWPEYVTPS